jgi:hypothetical protein
MLTPQAPPDVPEHNRDIDWETVVDGIVALEGDPESEGWANLGTFSPGIADYIRKGKNRAFLDLGITPGSPEAEGHMSRRWEITTRTTSRKPHRIDLYIRVRPS